MSTTMTPLAAWNLGELQVVPMPEINHYFGGGVYAKETKIPAGMMLQQHVHAHDHLSILSSGTVSVAAGGEPMTYEGPTCITIKAGIAHEVFAHTDATWYCVHATEETNPNKVDKVLIA